MSSCIPVEVKKICCQMKADAQTDDLVADINNKIQKARES